MMNSLKMLLFRVNPQAISLENGITSNLNPVIDNVTELEDVAIITKVSNVFMTVDGNL